MHTDDFHFFVRVAELGSISQAAKEADISVSVASQRIQRLEQHLMLRLFYRTTRRLTLTDEGKILLKQGYPLIQEFQTLKDNLLEQNHELTGTLKLTASATFGAKILTSVIAQFLLHHPKLNIILDLNDQNVDLIEHGFDVAIRIGKLQDSSLIAKPLMDNPRLLCAAPEYLAHHGMPKTPNDLLQHQCIVQNHQQGLSHTWQLFDNENNAYSVKVSGQFISNSGDGIRQASLVGVGISNHSLWHVQEDLASGKLVQVLPNYTVEPTQVYAITPDRKLVPQKVSVFIEYLQNYFQKTQSR